MPRLHSLARSLIGGALGLCVGCIPYSVGSTAQTVPPGTHVMSTLVYGIPNGASLRDSASVPFVGVDGEMRIGVADDADAGVRIVSGSGIVLNYKKRIAGHAGEDSAAVAVMFGAGFVNLFEHAHFEASLLASSAAHGPAVFYGGLRAMQVAPLTPHAVHDTPTAGALFGVRLGNATEAVLPEIAVYYDHSALGLRRGNIIYVPSITLRGDLLRRVLRPF